MSRLLALLALLSLGSVAHAESPSPLYCHAVTPIDAPDPGVTTCTGEPRDYERARLWLTTSVDYPASEGVSLLVHQTRFQRLAVTFGYADGSVVTHRVEQGRYGEYWRVGGQLVFDAPARDSPLADITLAIDGLASYPYLRIRLMPARTASSDASLAASLVGGALTLLALSALYNLLLAAASRRAFIGWHAAWVATMVVWGLLWSQLALLVVPGMAGTLSAQICTLLSTLAIAFATMCAVTSLAPASCPRWARRLTMGLAALIPVGGLIAAFPPPGTLAPIGVVLGYAVLLDLALVICLIGWACWRGDRQARDFALAWALPMAVLASTHFVDYGSALAGGGSQIAVLIASALQTVWLSVASTWRLQALRAERDAAWIARAEMQQLAERDPLTGLLNRRGLLAHAAPAIEERRVALMLIDIDHFKSINDRFGHDRGDAVLRAIAERIAQDTGDGLLVARLGGEEFAVAIDAQGPTLFRIAERVRRGIAAIDLDTLLEPGCQVTASIGIAVQPAQFDTMYRNADKALYAAKDAGRNRVCIALGKQIEPAPLIAAA